MRTVNFFGYKMSGVLSVAVVIKYQDVILGAQVSRKESNNMNLRVKWIVNFKGEKTEIECRQ